MLAAGIFGVPVAKSLSASGFGDPTSESASAKQLLTDKFHQGDMQMLITVSARTASPAGRPRGGSRHRRSAEAISARHRGDVGVDRATGGRDA